jgi:hypothetical protein
LGVDRGSSSNPIDRFEENRKMNEPIGKAARMKQGAAKSGRFESGSLAAFWRLFETAWKYSKGAVDRQQPFPRIATSLEGTALKAECSRGYFFDL